MKLNIVFHNIVSNEEEIDDPEFTITTGKFKEILGMLEELMNDSNTFFNDINLYFDDGYRSIKEIALPLLESFIPKTVLAITTDFVGKKGFLSLRELKEVSEMYRVVSHGVSHSALAIYDKTDKFLLSTKKDGKYRNTKFGKSKSLSENEVLYQFKESKKFIEKQLLAEVNEFVFPFGLYNEDVVGINDKQEAYEYLSTCDEGLDKGDKLKPRYLIYNTKSLTQIREEILKLR